MHIVHITWSCNQHETSTMDFWFNLVKRRIERSKKLIQKVNVEIEEIQNIIKILPIWNNSGKICEH